MKGKEYIYFKDISAFDEFLSQNRFPVLSKSEIDDYRPITKVYRYCYQGCWLTISLMEKSGDISFTLSSAVCEGKRMLFNIGLVSPACIRAYKDEEKISIEIDYEETCSEEIIIPIKKEF